MKTGILSLQGSVQEHFDMVQRAGDSPLLVKEPGDFQKIDLLILPGGESTTILKLLKIKELDKAIVRFAESGKPVWGTCAGLILLVKLGLIDIDVERNGWGSQIHSFEKEIDFNSEMVKVKFIRAPRIKSLSSGVIPLSSLDSEVIAARKERLMVTTFHPEVTEDTSVYRYFRKL